VKREELLKQEVLTPQEVASILMVHARTVNRYLKEGKLDGFITNPGSSRPRWRVYAESVRKLMKLSGEEPRSEGNDLD